MKTLLTILISLITVACGTGFEKGSIEVDSELQPYVESFYHQASIRGIYAPAIASVKFSGELRSEEVNVYRNGEAHVYKNRYLVGFNYVKISKSEWKLLSNCHKNQLVYHEMFHASLYKQHVTAKGQLMSAYLVPKDVKGCLNMFKPANLTKLFKE